MTKEQEVIERANKLLELSTPFNNSKSLLIRKIDIETVLNMLEKKDKMIDLYIDKLARDEFDDCCQECCRECERDYDTLSNCIKQYFERKATNNG